tara:strand:- start:193 stop:372 length:180 start_codon:yes stop_codon:yes gene_type:complete
MTQRYRVSVIVESDDVDPGHLLDAMIELAPQLEDYCYGEELVIDEATACVSDVDEKATA